MNIAWYSHYFTPEIGAPSARIYELSQNWIRMGHHVKVVTCFPNHPVGKVYPGYKKSLYLHETLNGIDVYRNWTFVTPNKGLIKKIFGHVSLLPSSLLIGNRHLGKTDLVIGTSPTFFAAIAAATTGIQRNIPFIMEIRDLWPDIFVELGILKNRIIIRFLELIELALYRRATRVVTVTKSFGKNLIKKGISGSKIVTISNGADTTFWTPQEKSVCLCRELGLENRFIVLYIGAHGISHALGKILESAESLRNVADIHFLFVGEGAERNNLIRQAKQARLENVSFLEPVDKEGVKAFYSIADVCIVPLRNVPLFDAFIPSKMFEIMAMGKPMVASITGEAADIIKRSGGGIVVMPEDSEAIAAALVDLYQSPEKRRKMGIAGRVFVSSYYNRRFLASRYMDLLEEAVTGFRRGVNS